jgi:murein DD-endopeptidase MepM/ murein hydrolase activator NlpD
MEGNRIWALALVAFALVWVAAGVLTSRAIATFAGGLDVEVRLAGRDLLLPVSGGRPRRIMDSATGSAMEIPAPRGTPVVATDNGRILAIASAAGAGVTLYQADSANDIVYAYAQLERCAPGLREGSTVKRGETIGYVGTGSASVLGPHLRFAILRLPKDKQWANATSIDAFPYYVKAKASMTLAATSVSAVR